MSGGFGGLAQVLQGIEAALEAGLRPVKVNTVVQRGRNDHTVLDVLEHFRGTGVTVRLIEYMDVGTRNHWNLGDVVPSAERWQGPARAGACRRRRAATVARSPNATSTTTARARSASCPP